MDEKKTFGAYILHRRKELGMTQKEFAAKLYVTESAVSKWERGLSYPDITLLRSICAVLDITEHELLTGSEDSEHRTAERLARRYLKASGRWRAVQYLVYGAIVFGCFLGNLLSEHALSWFWIALTACMTAASVTLAPSVFAMKMQTERLAVPLSAALFTGSLVLLLVSGCAYSGGDWYAVGASGALLGVSALMLPFLMKKLPLGEFWQGRKLSLWLLINTALLLLLLLASCVWSGGNWFAVAAVGTLFGLGFVVLPVLLAQMPLPEKLKTRRISLFLAVQTALLLLLIYVSCICTGGDWFVIASVSTLFGLGFFMLPVLLKQILPPPFSWQKALLYFALQTFGLFAVLICADWYSGASVFWDVSLPIALLCLALPWGVMLICRYLPSSCLLRASAALLWTNAWIWLMPKGIESVLIRAFGVGQADSSFTPWRLNIPYDFSVWTGPQAAYNVFAILLFTLLGAALLLAAADVLKRRKQQ